MSNTYSVLAHIAASDPQKENVATEALAFILNRSAAARGALHRHIVALGGSTSKIARVATQPRAGEESRPDLEFVDENGRRLGYIEAKFWAGLTDAQPVEYVRRLAEAGGGSLIILAPERRLPMLRVEVMERLKAADLAPGNLAERSMAVGTVRLGLLPWPTLLSALHDAAAEDRDVASDVHQLRGLVAHAESDGFAPLSRSVLDDLEVPRRAVALTDLSSEIVDKAVAEGLMNIKGVRTTPQWYGGGRYAAFKSAGCWVGLEHEIWSRRGRSPLWMVFWPDKWNGVDRIRRLREVLRAWLSSDPPRAYLHEEDGQIEIPILLLVGVEKQRVVADAVRQLRELDAVLRRAKLPPFKGTAPADR